MARRGEIARLVHHGELDPIYSIGEHGGIEFLEKPVDHRSFVNIVNDVPGSGLFSLAKFNFIKLKARMVRCATDRHAS